MSQFNPDRLEALRESHGLRKGEFLKRIGLTLQAYQDLLHGKTKPNVVTIEAIAAAFNVDCGYFFTRSGVHNGRR